ncbi:MAG: hypothetical protein A2V88_05175 [Elusimicrobia bacterium RBG_16_66_12]|nr:MAG: hypothetical protein A2V88_05175 [Elusimicrobia bacterium RBG_16_66_12]
MAPRPQQTTTRALAGTRPFSLRNARTSAPTARPAFSIRSAAWMEKRAVASKSSARIRAESTTGRFSHIPGMAALGVTRKKP